MKKTKQTTFKIKHAGETRHIETREQLKSSIEWAETNKDRLTTDCTWFAIFEVADLDTCDYFYTKERILKIMTAELNYQLRENLNWDISPSCAEMDLGV